MTDVTNEVAAIPEDAVDFPCEILEEGTQKFRLRFDYNEHEGLEGELPASAVFAKTDHGIMVDNAAVTQMQLASATAATQG